MALAVWSTSGVTQLTNPLSPIERSASLRQEDGEDRITIDVIAGLHRAGYNATHNGYSN